MSETDRNPSPATEPAPVYPPGSGIENCPPWCIAGHQMIAGTSDSCVSETDRRDIWTHMGPEHGDAQVWADQIQGEPCGEPYVWVCPSDGDQVGDPARALAIADAVRAAAHDLHAIREGFTSHQARTATYEAKADADGHRLPDFPKPDDGPCPEWCTTGPHVWESGAGSWEIQHWHTVGHVSNVEYGDPKPIEVAVAQYLYQNGPDERVVESGVSITGGDSDLWPNPAAALKLSALISEATVLLDAVKATELTRTTAEG
jgi:hypothetical protein